MGGGRNSDHGMKTSFQLLNAQFRRQRLVCPVLSQLLQEIGNYLMCYCRPFKTFWLMIQNLVLLSWMETVRCLERCKATQETF